ncbi:MAG TPA: BadF/BadG/BcrA/BcrD ATPase family protein [Terriglobales bacterium]
MYFIGIDAGGTKTAFAVGDGKRVLATVQTGSVKLGSVDEETARKNLRDGVSQAFGAAGVAKGEIKGCCVGLSGASVPQVREVVRTELREVLPGCEVMIVGDHVVAHRAAFPDGNGVLTVCGTGSICYGRRRDGRELRIGGHGSVISDEGSGFWIGRECFRRLLRARDVGESPALLQELIQRFGDGNERELVRRANAGVFGLAELVPLVVQAAQSGDAMMSSVLQDAGGELAGMAVEVASRLYEPSEEVPFALVGGVAGASQVLREAFERRMRDVFAAAEFRAERLSPVEGAVILARASSVPTGRG